MAGTNRLLCADCFCSVTASSPSKCDPELNKPCSAVIVFRIFKFLSGPLKPRFILSLVSSWLHCVRNVMKGSVSRRPVCTQGFEDSGSCGRKGR